MPGMGVNASFVLIIPCRIQGCRPVSVTVQPASTAIKPNGVAKANNLQPAGSFQRTVSSIVQKI
jgi:hypothetical protein